MRAAAEFKPPPSLRDLEDDEGRIPYDDGPVPKGYRLTTRVRRGLIIPGSIMFGVSYGLTALVALGSISNHGTTSETAACANTDYLGLLPLAGGYAWGYQADRKCSSSFGFRTFFGTIDSAVQIAGGTMMVIAFLAPEKYLVRDVAALPNVSVRIVPGTQLTSNGLSLAGKF